MLTQLEVNKTSTNTGVKIFAFKGELDETNVDTTFPISSKILEILLILELFLTSRNSHISIVNQLVILQILPKEQKMEMVNLHSAHFLMKFTIPLNSLESLLLLKYLMLKMLQ